MSRRAARRSRRRMLATLCGLLTMMPLTSYAQGWSARAQPERFSIHVPDAVLIDLHDRLTHTRWPDQLPGTGWDYGADTAYLRQLITYWRDTFDWRAQEARLNRFEHFHASVGGMRIHFMHVRSSNADAVPLLLLHGWPSSFVQMLEIIPLLVDPAAHGLAGSPSFHVVVASLPGFGFSEIPTRTGVGFRVSASMMAELMHDVLGYPRYAVRGSDLGGNIVRQMALLYPDQILGVHLTGMIGTDGGTPPYTPAEQRFIEATNATLSERYYARLQMTKPQTLAHALNDSPVGLAAWIVEKFRAWSDTDGVLERRFSKDDLLTNLMVYWVTGSAPASVRMYYEFSHESLAAGRIEVPVGMLMSTKDLFPPAPREWGERFFNVQRWSETNVGGHFLEWEEPALVARELQAFFGAVTSR